MKKDTTNVGKYKQCIKKVIDNDSFVFVYETADPIAIAREELYKNYIKEDNTIVSYMKDIIERLNFCNNPKNIYYKNNDGKWINFSTLSIEYSESTDLIEIANTEINYSKHEINVSFIPEVHFTDKEGEVHYIEEADGTVKTFKRVININEKDENEVRIEQWSIDNPGYKSDRYNHRKEDLKVTLIKETAENLVIWLNGVFVEPLYDREDNKVFYIKDAKNFINTVPLSIADSDMYDYSNIEVLKVRKPKYKYYYNIDMRIWKWEDTRVSNSWISVRHTKSRRIVHNYIGYDVVTELYFEQEINPNANMLFLNGQMLSKDEYSVDLQNRKHVYLHKVYDETHQLIQELIEKGYYDFHMALNVIIKNRNYYAINFNDTDGTRRLYVKQVKPVKTNFPGINDIIFNNTALSDMVLVDGFFIPYILLRNGVYRFPRTTSTYITNDSNMSSSNIWKIEMVNN